MKKLFFSLLLLGLLVSCRSNNKTSKYNFASSEQREDVEKFLRNLLFFERGVYTLLGSKPVTVFDLFEPTEDLTQSIQNFLDYPGIRIYVNKDKESDLCFYSTLKEVDKKKVVLFSDENYIFNIYELWEK